MNEDELRAQLQRIGSRLDDVAVSPCARARPIVGRARPLPAPVLARTVAGAMVLALVVGLVWLRVDRSPQSLAAGAGSGPVTSPQPSGATEISAGLPHSETPGDSVTTGNGGLQESPRTTAAGEDGDRTPEPGRTTSTAASHRFAGAFALPTSPRTGGPSVGYRDTELVFGNAENCVWMVPPDQDGLPTALGIDALDMVLWPAGWTATLDPPRIMDESNTVVISGTHIGYHGGFDWGYSNHDLVPEECRTLGHVFSIELP